VSRGRRTRRLQRAGRRRKCPDSTSSRGWSGDLDERYRPSCRRRRSPPCSRRDTNQEIASSCSFSSNRGTRSPLTRPLSPRAPHFFRRPARIQGSARILRDTGGRSPTPQPPGAYWASRSHRRSGHVGGVAGDAAVERHVDRFSVAVSAFGGRGQMKLDEHALCRRRSRDQRDLASLDAHVLVGKRVVSLHEQVALGDGDFGTYAERFRECQLPSNPKLPAPDSPIPKVIFLGVQFVGGAPP
jgi:hypothetical protein